MASTNRNKILLVEPDFPYPNKSKNRANGIHKNFVPIGLLKLGAYHKNKGDKVKLVRGNKTKKELSYFRPNKIFVTSLFTYWSKYVWDSVRHYRELFSDSKIILGGIYTTLHYRTPEFKKLSSRYRTNYNIGLHPGAEKFLPDYSLLQGKVSYHALHAMRGCIRRCKFCGVWKLESKMTSKNTQEIVNEITSIGKNKVIFYDNNFLANSDIKDILRALSNFKINGKSIVFESQSGFDGRLVEKDPELALLLKKAGFRNIRIAWDHSIDDAPKIKRQINYFVKVGYPTKDTSVFVLYNFDIPYKEILRKIKYCKKWGVQIIDCRYRPLDSTSDNYNPHVSSQKEGNYYIHKESDWSDAKIRNIRRKVRKHNIEIRYGSPYDKKMERWSAIHNTFKFFGLDRPPKMKKIENSRVLQKRIKLMNKIKDECKRHGLTSPDLRELSSRRIDKKLKEWCQGIKPKNNYFRYVLDKEKNKDISKFLASFLAEAEQKVGK